jgi:hypothetical protein
VLTLNFVANGIARYNLDGSSVWNVDEIKTALSQISNNKCAYCELPLGEGAAYLEVEHFLAKTHHPNRLLEWDNLLPACRRCNGKKGDWDVTIPGQMMVDPATMDPRVHIRIDEAYRPIGLTPEGENTIVEIALDDIQRLGVMRYKLGETFKRKIEELYDIYTSSLLAPNMRKRRAAIRKIKAALEMSGSDQPFSAVIATVLMRSTNYAALKAEMLAAGDWDAELRSYDMMATEVSLS